MPPRCPKGTRKNKKSGECEPVVQKPNKSKEDGEGIDWEVVHYLPLDVNINEKILPACAYLYTSTRKFTDDDMICVLNILRITRALVLKSSDSTQLWHKVFAYETDRNVEVSSKNMELARKRMARVFRGVVDDVKENNIDDSAVRFTAYLLSA